VDQVIIEEIRQQNIKIITEINNLARMIIRINEVIYIIDGIADQTKLIAFIVSLVASGAGEAGARFSVVASKIQVIQKKKEESLVSPQLCGKSPRRLCRYAKFRLLFCD
jgi:methyl-accepting chemotaxis protein